jgi:YfiR/HmsC-like
MLLASLVSVFALGQACAQTPLSEGQIKTALVLNFARYVDWPESAFASAAEPVSICMIGRDSLGGALATLETKQIQNRAIKVKNAMTIEDTRSCHVVFIADSEERRLVPILKNLSERAVLTVSDISGFVDSGGGIGIVQGETRWQFEVNRRALEASKLKASSNLLKLARNLNDASGKN